MNSQIESNEKPLKIALVRKRYTAFGGAERVVDMTINALKQYDADITLITSQWTDTAPCNTHICESASLTRTGREKKFSTTVQKHLNQVRYDLVQSHERIPGCNIFRAGDGLHRCWLQERKKILSPLRRLAQAISPFHRHLIKTEEALFTSDKLKAVICISDMVKQELLKQFSLPEEMLHVIYNGVDTQKFHPKLKTQHRLAVRKALNINDETPVMLYVGSGFERKGLPTLIKAMGKLSDKCHLIIVGKDKKTSKYQSLATRLQLEQNIHILGPQNDVAPYYGAADMFVFPTLYEPFGNVVLEAMASGLPVITSTKCGAAEIVKSSGSGFVCDALDVDSLASHIETLCSNRKLRDQMGVSARKAVESMTPENMAQQLIELYEKLLPQKTH